MTVATFPAYEYKYKKRLSDMIRRILHIQPGQQLYSLDENIKFIQPRSLGVPIWWTNNGAIPAPLLAYRAVNTPGSAWGAGPATLAESYDNLVGNAAYDLTPGVAPTLDANGWLCDNTRLLYTGFTPPGVTQAYSVMALVSYGTSVGGSAPFGCNSGANRAFTFFSGPGGRNYLNGGTRNVAGTLFNGGTKSVGFAGNQGFLNGAADGATIGAWAGDNTVMLTLLVQNFTVPFYYMVGYVKAFWLAAYTATPTQMSTMHTIMLAL